MFCQKCGGQLILGAPACGTCGAKVLPVKFCKNCGNNLPGDATYCTKCMTAIKPDNKPEHYISIGCWGVGFFMYFVLGGDGLLGEVNIFDYLTIPLTIIGIVAGALAIPSNRMALKVVSIVFCTLLLLSAGIWVLTQG